MQILYFWKYILVSIVAFNLSNGQGGAVTVVDFMAKCFIGRLVSFSVALDI